MKITIKAKNIELTPDLQSFIDEKISPLKRFIDILKEDTPEIGKTLAEVLVDVEKETDHHRKGQLFNCRLEIILPGRSLLASSQSDDEKKAIIEARRGLRQEIEKYKFKITDKHRKLQEALKEEIEI